MHCTKLMPSKNNEEEKVIGNQQQVNTGFTAEVVTGNIEESKCPNLRDTHIQMATTRMGLMEAHLLACNGTICFLAALADLSAFLK